MGGKKRFELNWETDKTFKTFLLFFDVCLLMKWTGVELIHLRNNSLRVKLMSLFGSISFILREINFLFVVNLSQKPTLYVTIYKKNHKCSEFLITNKNIRNESISLVVTMYIFKLCTKDTLINYRNNIKLRSFISIKIMSVRYGVTTPLRCVMLN